MDQPSRIFMLFAAASVAALPARAEDAGARSAGPPSAVQGKLYQLSGRWEVGVAFTAALNASLVDQYGGLLSISYHPNEWLDFGVDLLANRTSLSSLTGQIRSGLPARADPSTGQHNTGDEMEGGDQLRGALLAMARFAPIYGKLSLAAELPIHFQAYLLAGAGGAGFKHESINLCGAPGAGTCAPGDYQNASSVKPIGEAGAGMRFYLGQRWSLRAEIRGFFYPATVVRGADMTQPGTGSSARYLGTFATLALGASALF